MTRFKEGSWVRSLVDAQGLTKGAEYVVRTVDSEAHGIFGTFTKYGLVPAGAENSPTIYVGNGHLILAEVA